MQVAALVVFILTLAPSAFFVLVGALVIVSFVLSLIPVLGRFHSLQTLALGAFMSMVGTIVSAQIVAEFKFSDVRTGQYIIIPISAVFGFIPLFMYGAWLGAQVKGGF